MDRIEFAQLQQEVASSGMTLKSFLAEKKIPHQVRDDVEGRCRDDLVEGIWNAVFGELGMTWG